ncbi:MAG: nicotinamide riboside transporter PnuC [Roseburia sp.]|nr:nicotinamide riboside transporter PnuC [Roseburia sp.]
MKKLFGLFNIFDITLWTVSVVTIALSFGLSPSRDYLTLVSSITGVTALLFIVKGHVLGQFLTVAFAVVYGVVSYFFRYYGEIITYLGMSAPAAIMCIISWLRHPYKKRTQVEISKLTGKKAIALPFCTAAVTAAFYFILRELGTAKLAVSTVSVATSFFAAYLTFFRSPLYGLAYACNDVVLIAMWILAAVADIAYVPMIICFALFLVYDVYGFINWSRMRKNQTAEKENVADRGDGVDTDASASAEADATTHASNADRD